MEKHKSLKLISFLLSTFIVFSSLSGVVGAEEVSIGNNNSSSSRIEDYDNLRADNNDQIIAPVDSDNSITSPVASPEDSILAVDEEQNDITDVDISIADEIPSVDVDSYLDDLYDDTPIGTIIEATCEMETITADDLSGCNAYDAAATATSGVYKYRFTGTDALTFQKLEGLISDVAYGRRTTTNFTIPYSDLGLSGKEYTASDLGVSAIVSNGRINPTAQEALMQKALGNTEAILDTMLADLPFEMYWYDKTAGLSFGVEGMDAKMTNNGWVLYFTGDGVGYYFSVASEYSAGEYKVKAAKVNAAVQAANNAKAIVSKYASLSDYEKLVKYKEEICKLTDYDSFSASTNTAYGDPWQMVYVFDNNASTKVVCEGYSKAFKYLCDQSTFSGTVECLLVYGNFMCEGTSGPHMWNVISFGNGKNYLVDVTNCDDNHLGAPDLLFIRNATKVNSVSSYSFSCPGGTATYVYDDEVRSLVYRDEYLKITTEAYSGSSSSTSSPTPTVKPTATATPKPTATSTPKPTATSTPKPTATPKPTVSATPKPTAKPTATPKPNPNSPVGPSKPSSPTNPNNPSSPVGPTKPSSPSSPNNPSSPVGPTKPSSPSSPNNPSSPVGPTKPSSPSSPYNPSSPVGPTKPSSPSSPYNPSSPVGPTKPSSPTNPNNPSSPVGPSNPSSPSGPSKPSSPTGPRSSNPSRNKIYDILRNRKVRV